MTDTCAKGCTLGASSLCEACQRKKVSHKFSYFLGFFIAIFRASARTFSRSKGQSAVASAVCRGGLPLYVCAYLSHRPCS